MSVSISLIPIAIAIGITMTGSSVAAVTSIGSKNDSIAPVETIFNDCDLLIKTLTEHGMKVEKLSENELFVKTDSGTVRYFRKEAGKPFFLETGRIKNIDELMESLDSLENEYGRNVQAFTYGRVKTALAEHGMAVADEEVLEDDTIVLTLSV